MRNFDVAAPVASRRVPRQLVAADAGVPTALVVVIGGLVTVTTYALLTALFRASRHGDYWRLMPATRFWAAVFVGGLVSGWWLLWRWLRVHAVDALYTIEEFSGRDLDRDGQVGVPAFRIEAPIEPGYKQIWELPGTIEQFQKWAAAITAHTTTTAERNWTGGDNPVYDSGDYEKLRDRLMQAGVARWRNPRWPNLGWTVTDYGYPWVLAAARGEFLPLPPPQALLTGPES